jgi:hypothetical protein
LILNFRKLSSVYQICYHAQALRCLSGGWSLTGIAKTSTGRRINITISHAAAALPGGYNLTYRQDRVPSYYISLTEA